MPISVPWGTGELSFELPADWTVQQVAQPQLRAAGNDWPDRLAAALNQPETHLPLSRLLTARKNGRIAIIVEDLTRHSPLPEILELVMREIRHARIDSGQIEIVFATGMHPPLTPQQAEDKLGPAAEGIARRSNPWQDPSRYAYVGRTGKLDVMIDRGVLEADLRIIISSVSPHLQAGFGGGYKMLLPGCSSLETIRQLHRLGLSRSVRQLVGTQASHNPMRSAIDQAGLLIDASHGKSFAVQYLLDEHNLPAFMAAGEVVPTQQMLAKQCAVACGIMMSAPADVVIANAHPRDFDLWQSFKSLANTLWAARPGGVVICLTRCEAGLNGMKAPSWPLSALATRRILRAVGAEALGGTLRRLVPSLAGDAAFFVQIALQALHRNRMMIVSPTLHEAGVSFPGIEIFGHIEQAVAAVRAVNDAPQRVTVFPVAGTTFPIPMAPVFARAKRPELRLGKPASWVGEANPKGKTATS